MIYLIRHGEPAAGWGDHLDPGLSSKGHEQAAAAAEVIARNGAKRAITSPMARCRETAKPFEKLIETHARIETAVGEVRTPAGVSAEERVQWLRGVMGGSWTDAGPGFEAWRQGIMTALKSVPDETAIFSHFVAINVVVGLLTGDDRVTIFRPAHCSVTRLARIDGKLSVAELGGEGTKMAL